MSRSIELREGWLHLPIGRDAQRRYVRFEVDGRQIAELRLGLVEGEPDFWCGMELEKYIGQAVTLEHPHFREFLVRDIGNILRFFRKYGIRSTTEDVLKIVREKRPEDEPYIRKIREEEEAAENADENEDAEEDAQSADAEK